MRVLDLFSGIGGFSLGLHRAGMETVAFCKFVQNKVGVHAWGNPEIIGTALPDAKKRILWIGQTYYYKW